MHDTQTSPTPLGTVNISNTSRQAATAITCVRCIHPDRRLLTALSTHWAFCTLLLLCLNVSLGLCSVHSADEPGSGTLLLHVPEGDLDALVLNTTMDLQVRGLLTDLTLDQSFTNTTGQWVEGSYLFPLPPDASVRGLRITVGDRVINGVVQRREEARQNYDAATRAGQITGLIEQQRPNLFTMRVGNIPPDGTLKVRLEVMLPVTVVDEQLQLILPTTLTPRYSNAATRDAAALQTTFAGMTDMRGPRLDVSLTIEPLKDHSVISSDTHTLQYTKNSVNIVQSPMDQDLHLSWPMQSEQATRAHAMLSEFDNERYVQLLVNPPARRYAGQPMARELLLVVDKSGSMAGVSMRAAIEALNYAIDGLNSEDYLNIVAFDDRTHPLFSHARKASNDIRRKARRFADQLVADGGTEMAGALDMALRSHHSRRGATEDKEPRLQAFPNNDNAMPLDAGTWDHSSIPPANSEEDSQLLEDAPRLRQIVFITDGSVGYEDQLLQTIRNQLGASRLFTVGIGPAPNTWFLEKAAEAGRGISVSISNENDVASAVTDLLGRLAHPVLTDLNVQFPQGRGEIYPRPLPDLYLGRPGMWVAKVSDDVASIVITGKSNGERWREEVFLAASPVDHEGLALNAGTASAPSVAMDWTRRKIDALFDEQRYAADEEMHRASITQLALDVGLVTQYTSMVAIEEEAARPAGDALAAHQVASLIPKGNTMFEVAMPRGAAGVDTLSWLSLIFGIAGMGLYCRVRQV